MEINLPPGIEMKKDANNLYLHCLVCGMRIGVFDQEIPPKRIKKIAIEHVTSDLHMTSIRIVNCFERIREALNTAKKEN